MEIIPVMQWITAWILC